MKICHIITGLEFGGAETLLVNLTNIQIIDHEVYVVYLKGIPRLEKKFDTRVIIVEIPLGRGIFKKIREYIIHIKPDAVHTHLGHADLISMWALRGLKINQICTMHNIWFKWNWIDYVIFACYYIFFKTIARKYKVICISSPVLKHVIKRLGVKTKNTFLVFNSIPNIILSDNKLELRKQLNINENEFAILFVGRLSVQKSVETLLQAVFVLKEKLPMIKLYVIGEGDREQFLKGFSHSLQLVNNVEFRGAFYEPEKYFAACDIFVLPSVFEGLGIVILEAFRAKLPVIATSIEGPAELINNGINGLLFNPIDHMKLAENIEKLHNDQQLRIKLGNAGYQSFKGSFEIKNYAERIEEIYKIE